MPACAAETSRNREEHQQATHRTASVHHARVPSSEDNRRSTRRKKQLVKEPRCEVSRARRSGEDRNARTSESDQPVATPCARGRNRRKKRCRPATKPKKVVALGRARAAHKNGGLLRRAYSILHRPAEASRCNQKPDRQTYPIRLAPLRPVHLPLRSAALLVRVVAPSIVALVRLRSVVERPITKLARRIARHISRDITFERAIQQ
jgi:hypothetical protein